MNSVKMMDDSDADVFIKTLLRNGYWVHVENPESTKERMEGYIVIYFEEESEDE